MAVYRRSSFVLRVRSSASSNSREYSASIERSQLFQHPSFDSLPKVTSKEEFLKLFEVTPPIKEWPPNLNHDRLISMIRQQRNLDLALQIFHHAGNFLPGFSHNHDTYRVMIEKLSYARAFSEMETLISQLKKSKIKCGERLFLIIIRNYGVASRPKDAVRTFLNMTRFGVHRTLRSFNILLNALVQNKRYDLVHLMFKHSKMKFGLNPDCLTCNILIKALCKKNDIEGAIRIMEEMPGMGLIPNVVSYTTLLAGYVSRGNMLGAKEIFDLILDRGCPPDVTTYTIMMHGFCKLGRFLDAIKLMDDMEENGVKPNYITYGLVIEAYCRDCKSGEALNLLYDMIHRRYIPTSTTCCKVIDLLCSEGKVETACDVWNQLIKKNCALDSVICSTLIYWLCKKGKTSEAKELFDGLGRGLVPSAVAYNTLIAGMCDKGDLYEVGKLWDGMVEKGYKPSSFTYNVLINGLCRAGNVEEGVRVLEEMVANECLPDKSTFSILLESVCISKLEAVGISSVLGIVA